VLRRWLSRSSASALDRSQPANRFSHVACVFRTATALRLVLPSRLRASVFGLDARPSHGIDAATLTDVRVAASRGRAGVVRWRRGRVGSARSSEVCQRIARLRSVNVRASSASAVHRRRDRRSSRRPFSPMFLPRAVRAPREPEREKDGLSLPTGGRRRSPARRFDGPGWSGRRDVAAFEQGDRLLVTRARGRRRPSRRRGSRSVVPRRTTTASCSYPKMMSRSHIKPSRNRRGACAVVRSRSAGPNSL